MDEGLTGEAWSGWVPSLELQDSHCEILEVLARQLCEPGPSWRTSMDSLARCSASCIVDCYAMTSQNVIPALFHVQDGPDSTPDDRKSAYTLLSLLSHIAESTKTKDPYPESSDSELLRSLRVAQDRVVLPDEARVVWFASGETPQDDVVVVERLGIRELSLGVWQLDGFTETEMPCAVQQGSEGTHALLLSWINRAFGSVVRFAITRAVQAKHPRVLLLGLGGGSLAHFVLQSHQGAVVDAVDANPAVVAAARQCFGLHSDRYGARLNVHVCDAAEFVRKSAVEGSGWDLVLVDLYSADSVPEECTTREFLKGACSLLTVLPDLGAQGLVAFNCSRELEQFHEIVWNAKAVRRAAGMDVDVILPVQGAPDSVVSHGQEKASIELECNGLECNGECDSDGENMVDNALILFSSQMACGLCGLAEVISREAGTY